MAIFGFLVTLLLGIAVMIWTVLVGYGSLIMGAGREMFFLLIPFAVACALFTTAWYFCPFMVVMI